MYKIFILAASIAFFPLPKKNALPPGGNTGVHAILTIKTKEKIPAFFNAGTAQPADPWSQNWLAAAQENIRQSEYRFTWDQIRKAYCSPNRKNNLRFFYTDKGFTVEPRTTKLQSGQLDPFADPLKTTNQQRPNWKVRFNLDMHQVRNGNWQVNGNKAEYITENITVQYINNDEGMRQNFIVSQPLQKGMELKINLRIQTKLRTVLENNRLLFFHRKKLVLLYEDLKVWDANRRPLKAFFAKNKNGTYAIQVDTKGAVYPITIDPVSTTPDALLECNQSNADMGCSVSSAGDVNGDGYSDVIVGAYGYNNGQSSEGAAFIFHGSATGISTTVAAMVESNQGNALMGYAVSTSGDVNGDGYSDVIVGAPNYDNGQTNEGRVYVYHGSATGINTVAAATMESNQGSGFLGYSVASAGDVNADGYSDVAVGVYGYANGQTDEGAVFIYHGSASGINTAVAAIMQSNQANAFLGYSVASAGDVNGDGYSDVVAGAGFYDNGHTNEGAAFVYNGSATGVNTTPAIILESNQASSFSGYSVASAGDVNGDGYSDVAIGAYQYDNGQTDEGVVFVHHGSAAGVLAAPAATLESNQAGAYMGWFVNCAGDINGDGYSDLVTGVYHYANGQSDEGAAFIHMGSAAGIVTTAAAILENNQANSLVGTSVASAGDVNGDGYSDVIVGARQYDNGQTNEGAAFVYHGSAAGINTVYASTMEPNQANANQGYAVASAGDVNADGYTDVVIGAPLYDNSEANEGAAFIYHGSAAGINPVAAAMVESNQANASLGFSVAGAGDVNGDGYSDIIVGAPYFDNGSTDEGRAFIYHGSASGIVTAAAATVESNQANANLGYSVSSGGDVNGDGYIDVIAGAYRYDNGSLDEGAVFVYHGSSSGINTTAAIIVESNQVNAFLGYSVAGVGSVNADGFSDIIAGAPLYDNVELDEGAAYVFHGSLTGINAVAAAVLESNQTDARMGFSVSGAGDVNGDGYGDVICGALNYDNGETDEGVAFVYHGAAAGINTIPATLLQSNQATAALGYAVSNAGDVNGDGYSDVIVGAFNYDNPESNEGVAFIHHGSAAGINITVAAIIESNQVNAILGNAVAGAGDVNGDGYSDVLAGAFGFDNGSMNEGAAFVYHGNSPGLNQRNNLRLYNSDLVTPINSSNFIFANFGAGLFARSFLGRSKGKLVWETRLNYNAYSGTPITNSTFFTAEQSSYTDLGLPGLELRSVITKLLATGRYTRLRARVKYDPVTSITGQVYGPWRNVSSVIDANSLGALPLHLLSFNAAWLQKGRTAKLGFSTDKETGICCFEIEKSSDAVSFHSIGTVQAKNSPGVQQYSFIDNYAVDNKQFYRLKIKGISGQVEYSNIQQLSYNGASEILVFPNPAIDLLNIRLNGNYTNLQIAIFNTSGQVVKQISSKPTTGQTISIRVNDLPAGYYWLHLQSGNEKQVLQFVKY